LAQGNILTTDCLNQCSALYLSLTCLYLVTFSSQRTLAVDALALQPAQAMMLGTSSVHYHRKTCHLTLKRTLIATNYFRVCVRINLILLSSPSLRHGFDVEMIG